MRTGMFTVFGVFIIFATGMVWLPCLAGPANGPAIYRTTDAAGNPLFSDRPQGPDAVVVDSGPLNTISAAPVPRDQNRPRAGRDAASGYRLLEITSPENGATLRDPHRPIPVEVRLLPVLRAGDKLQLMDNGAVLDGRVLDAPERGLHVLRAQVVDTAGKVVMRSPPVRVQVHRTSVSRQQGERASSPAPATPGAAARPSLVR